MPFVRGFLRVVSRRGRPEHPIAPEEGGPPEWGIEEGEPPEVEPPEIDPPDPPGVWPPLDAPAHPIYPVSPDDGSWQPGEVWPPIRPPLPAPPPVAGQPLPKQLWWAAVYIKGHGVRWIVVDLNAIHRPDLPERPTPKR
jgi:hypothetical protein